MAAELSLDAAQSAVYHLLGAPGIASLTAACLTTDRAIDLGQLQELVKNGGEARQRLLFAVAAELYGNEQGVSLSELLAELDGEDLDRVLWAIAVVKRRRSTIRARRTICGSVPPNPSRGPRAAAGVDWSAGASLRWCLTRGTLATGSSRRVTTGRAGHPAARGRGAGWLRGVAVGTRRGPTVDDVGESPSASTLGLLVVDWRRASPSRQAPATGARTPGSRIASGYAAE